MVIFNSYVKLPEGNSNNCSVCVSSFDICRHTLAWLVLDLPNPIGISRIILGSDLFLRKTMSNGSKLLSFDSISLKFIQNQWVVDVAGYKVSAWHSFIFSLWRSQTSRITLKTLAKKVSNSRESRKVIQSNFLDPPDHIRWLQIVWQMQGHWEIHCNSWNSELY